MTDAYKKYKKIANFPQKALKKGFNGIRAWSPENNKWQLLRVPAATVAFNLYLAMWLFTRIGLENKLIEKLDERNANKQIKKTTETKFGRFINKIKMRQKKNPTISAFIAYYFMLLSFLGGGKVAYDFAHEQKAEKVELSQDNATKTYQKSERAKQNTFGAYKEKLQPITPWLIAQLIAAEGVKTNEEGLHIPYKDSKGIWTIGFGSTCLSDGSPVTENTPPMTTEEAYNLALQHIEDNETFFTLYCYSVADKDLTIRNTGEAFGLSSIIYNSGTKFIENKNDKNCRERFTILREELAKYGDDIPDSLVLKLFQKYPIRDKSDFGKAWIDSHKPQDMAEAIGGYMKDGAGMHWRRWLEAGLITGDINPKDLMECPIKGMYDFYMYMGGGTGKRQKGKFALWEKTAGGIKPIKSTYIAFKQWLKNPQRLESDTLTPIKRDKVKDFIPEHILKGCMNNKCEIGIMPPRSIIAKKLSNKKNKTVAFNDGILKIKNKQKDIEIIYPSNNEYKA